MAEIEPIELKINLITNIPDNVNDYEKEIFTFSKLYSPDLKVEKRIRSNAFPFFTFQVEYNEAALSGLTYSQIVETFFDKDEFFERFASNYFIPLKPPEREEEKEAYYSTRTSNINKNVMLMLKYLLPTRFPVINNHFSSYELFKSIDPMRTLFYNPFSSGQFIYLRLSSGIYTLKKVIWLNDFLNHPEYKKLLEDSTIKVAKTSSNRKLSINGITFSEIKSCYETKCKSSELQDLLYVGMFINEDESKDPYEIFIDVELIESEIKPEEEGDIKCPYFSEYLGEEFTRLVKEITTKRKKKKLKGEVVKYPLYSKENKTSRKKGDFVTEVEKDENKLRIKKEEDERYEEVDSTRKINYDKLLTKIFDDIVGNRIESHKTIKGPVKRYNINKKNLYFHLEEGENRSLTEVLNYIIDPKDDTKKTKLLKIYNEFKSYKEQMKRYKQKYYTNRDELNKNNAYDELVTIIFERLFDPTGKNDINLASEEADEELKQKKLAYEADIARAALEKKNRETANKAKATKEAKNKELLKSSEDVERARINVQRINDSIKLFEKEIKNSSLTPEDLEIKKKTVQNLKDELVREEKNFKDLQDLQAKTKRGGYKTRKHKQQKKRYTKRYR
jgi:hypothetical protein